MREEGERLEHHAEVALVRGRVGQVLALEPDPPGARRLEAGDAAQQGGLATAGRPEKADQQAVRKLQIDIDQRLETTERLAHVLDAQGHDISPRAYIAPPADIGSSTPPAASPHLDGRQPAIISVHF